MMKQISITMRILPLLVLFSLFLNRGAYSQTTNNPEKLTSETSVVGIKINASEKQVLKKIGPPQKKDKSVDHDEVTCTLWHYSKKGLTLGMVYDKRDESVVVGSIVLETDSPLKLPNGIGIGASLEAVRKAYSSYYDKKDSEEVNLFVAGSPSQGVMFLLEKEKVKKIGIGYEPFSSCN